MTIIPESFTRDLAAELFGKLQAAFHRTEPEPSITSGSYPGAMVAWPTSDQRLPIRPESLAAAFFSEAITGSAANYAAFNLDSTSTGSPTDVLAVLSAAAQTDDERAFWQAVQAIDWTTRSPEEYSQAIRLALQIGAHMAARQLAQEGAARYPQSIGLQKFAQVLAPPRIIRRTAAQPEEKADIAWFKKHSAEYRGQWVAVKNGELLAAAPSLPDLQSQVPDLRSATITRVTW